MLVSSRMELNGQAAANAEKGDAGLAEEKNRSRRILKKELLSMDEAARKEASARIYERLISLPELDRVSVVFCYVSISNEADTRGLIGGLLEWGKTVCVPRCMENGIMEARAVNSLTDLSPRPPFGIPEPEGDAELIEPGRIDLAIVPGLAFDRQGKRLGKGAGYYDRYLAKCGALKCGICFDSMLRDSVPAGDTDVPMDIVITDRTLIRLYDMEETNA